MTAAKKNRIACVIILIFITLPTLTFSQSLLCQRDPITVYYVLNKTSAGPDEDEWKIFFDIENRGTIDLYYAVKMSNSHSNLPVNFFGGELLPSFLTVSVGNASGSYIDKQFFVHGTLTFHPTTDTTGLYKIAVRRYDKHMVTRTKKGELPQLSGKFTAELKPLDSMNIVRLKKK